MGRILIVDDDADSRESFSMIIQSWRHQVATAGDGHEALALLAAFQPHVIIVDLGMPGMDGIELVERIRQAAEYRGFVIALTGWTRGIDRDNALRAGCSLYLLKPADLDQLEVTL